jgi:hypothetical protein
MSRDRWLVVENERRADEIDRKFETMVRDNVDIVFCFLNGDFNSWYRTVKKFSDSRNLVSQVSLLYYYYYYVTIITAITIVSHPSASSKILSNLYIIIIIFIITIVLGTPTLKDQNRVTMKMSS